MSVYRTLADLRSELRARLGYAAAGAAAGVNQTILNSLLREAQNDLYWTHDWARLRRYTEPTIGANAHLIDYPATANPERIKAISISLNGCWTPALKRGIPPTLYTTQLNYAPPARWEPYEQIELWPATDKAYAARIFFIMALGSFSDDTDRATIDDDLIFKLALARGKGHYRQPDAATYEKDAAALLVKLKAKSWGQDVFSASDYIEAPVIAKPVVV